MEVILKKDVAKVGKSGSVIKVKDGFARNFLFPHNLAVPVTDGNLKKIEEDKQRKASQMQKLKQQAQDMADRLSKLSLTVPVLTHDDDQVYGSISAVEIEKALKDEGYDVSKNQIELEEQIKTVGIYEVPVKLHPEVKTIVKIWVVKK
ncbi:MAG: 50S ribosomal protein L9 [Candidatus Omnitrophota bacterium]|jgi:large subunit ribosomal protein L9|nr:MAG: 50S ribosomal protein L9 [Candidatus Omnitrophota bacterium]